MAKIKRSHLAVLIAALITMAITGTPLRGYAAGEPGCSATISADLINIPVVRLGDALYSLELQYLGASGNLIEFSIANVQTTSQECAVQSSITIGSSLMLNLASLMLGADYYDVGLEYVSSQERNASKVSAKNTSLTFEVKNIFKNGNVWKGSSYCTLDSKKAFMPGVYLTYIQRARGRNVTFFQLPEEDPELTYLKYKVLEGYLEFYEYIETVDAGGGHMVISSGPVETKMNISSGFMVINNLGFWGDGKETIYADQVTTLYSPVLPSTTSIDSGIAFSAEWLHIPKNVFQRTNPNELTGKWIENTSLSELTCDWRFYYYP